MDITTLLTGAGGVLGIGSTILYFRPKLKRMEAETEGKNLTNLQSVFDSLTEAYEKRLQITEGNYTLEINGIRRQHEMLQKEVNELRAKITDDEKVYSVDRERLKIMDACAVEMKKCPNFPTCVGATLYHKLINK